MSDTTVLAFIDKRNIRRRDGGDTFMTNNTAVVAAKATNYQASISDTADGVVIVSVAVGAVGKIAGPARTCGNADFVKRTFGRVDGVVLVEWESGATRTSTTRKALADAAMARIRAARR